MIGFKQTKMVIMLVGSAGLATKLLKVFFLLLLLQGCATPFSKFYYGKLGDDDFFKSSFLVLPTGEPQVYRGGNQEQDSLRMNENNYTLVGYSSFNAGNVDEKGAIDQAKKVHAAIVMLYSKYTGTQSGYAPLTLPNTTTSSTSINGNVYASGGYASYSGIVNTTTQGTKTTYIPYSVDKSDYLATYWIKSKPPRFGAKFGDITPEIKKQLSSNKGVLITAVIKGSPAFEANILNGDVLRQIGDISVFDEDSTLKAITMYEGRKVDLVIIREGKELQKSVKLEIQN